MMIVTPAARTGRCLAAATLLVVLAACSEPLEFVDWVIPVPDGTPVVEYAFVPDAERHESIALERDLVLVEAFGTPLYQPRGVKVAGDGRIFVLDGGNNRVVSFSPQGEALVAFGQEGQGPGEFQSPRNLGLVGNEVIVWDGRNARFSVYRLDGTHVVDHPREDRIYPSDYVGFEGHMLMLNPDPAFILPPGAESEPTSWRAGLYSPEGEQLEVALEFPYHFTMHWSRDRSAGSVPLRGPFPVGALGDGRFYATEGSEYQILAADAHGSVLWALRTNYSAPTVGEEEKRAVVDYLREFVPELTYQDFTWPERYAAIEGLVVDGRGNLYVFPHTSRTAETYRNADGPVPVDVYDPDGARIFSGTIPIEGWNDALGDAVYRVETDSDTQEVVVARYRIAGPGR